MRRTRSLLAIVFGVSLGVSFGCDLSATFHTRVSVPSGVSLRVRLSYDAGEQHLLSLGQSWTTSSTNLSCGAARLSLEYVVSGVPGVAAIPIIVREIEIVSLTEFRVDLVDLSFAVIDVAMATGEPVTGVTVKLAPRPPAVDGTRVAVGTTNSVGQVVLPVRPATYELSLRGEPPDAVQLDGQPLTGTAITFGGARVHQVRALTNFVGVATVVASMAAAEVLPVIKIDVDGSDPRSTCHACAATDAEGVAQVPIRSYPATLTFLAADGQHDVEPLRVELSKAPQQPLHVRLVRPRGRPVRVVVLDRQGKLVPNATIRLEFRNLERPEQIGMRSSTTGPDGAAELLLPDHCEGTARTTPPPGVGLEPRDTPFQLDPAQQELRIELESTISVPVVVRFPDGSLAAGIRVVLTGTEGRGGASITDAEGRAEVRVSSPGTYRFVVKKPVPWKKRSLGLLIRREGRRFVNATVRVATTDETVDPVQVELAEGTRLCVRVDAAVDEVVGPIQLKVQENRDGPVLSSTAAVLDRAKRTICSDPLGEGQYFLELVGDPGKSRFAPEWWPNGRSSADALPLTVRHRRPSEDVVMTLRPAGSLMLRASRTVPEVEGVRFRLCQQPLATKESQSVGPSCDDWPADLVYRQVGSDSRWMITGITPGNWQVQLCLRSECGPPVSLVVEAGAVSTVTAQPAAGGADEIAPSGP